MLWAYAPSTPTICHPPDPGCAAASYSDDSATSYYPGDDNVDIVCFDHYGQDDYSQSLLADCGFVTDFAASHGKVPAICETGIGGGVQSTNLTNFFTKVLLDAVTRDEKCSRIAYMLTWSEGPLFAAPNRTRGPNSSYWVPVEGDPTAPDFKVFAQSNSTVMAGQLGLCGLNVRAGCKGDIDCSLLGECDGSTGICKCHAGWKGPTCSAADLAPLNLSHGYPNATATTWGGRMVPDIDDVGVWHMFVSQLSHNCSFAYRAHNSFIARAVSTTGPAGPFVYAETVFPEFHLNPTVVGPTSDGLYLLFMVGKTNHSNVANCEHNNPHPFAPGSGLSAPAGTIEMAYAASPAGPWSEPRVVLQNFNRPTQNQSAWDCYVTNPSAVVNSDDSVLLVFSAVPCTVFEHLSLGFAMAAHWNGTYVQNPDPIWSPPEAPEAPAAVTVTAPEVYPVTTGSSVATSSSLDQDTNTNTGSGNMHIGVGKQRGAIGTGNVGDPFVWIDTFGHYHIVAHSQGATNLCGGTKFYSPNDYDYGNACGVHFFAFKPEGPWSRSPTPVYTAHTMLSNGSAAAFTTRQRPQLVFQEDRMSPAYMVNGGSFVEYIRDTSALERNFVFEFAGVPHSKKGKTKQSVAL